MVGKAREITLPVILLGALGTTTATLLAPVGERAVVVAEAVHHRLATTVPATVYEVTENGTAVRCAVHLTLRFRVTAELRN